MKIRSVFLSAFAMLAMGAVSVSAQAETTQTAEQMEEVLDHLGLLVEDLEFSEGEAFSILGRDRGGDRDRADKGNRGGNRDRANRGGGNRNRDRAGRGGHRNGRGDWRDRNGDGRMDRRHGNRGGHRDRDRRWRNDDDDDGRYWRRYPRTPRYPRYPIPPTPRVRCMAYGFETRKLYPVLGHTPSVVQEAAMDYCYRYNRRCEERGCNYE